MSFAALHALLQAGALVITPAAPTVGDTIIVTRAVELPADARARPQPLGSSLLVEPLADPLISRTDKGVVIRYLLAMFEAGRHPVGLPPVEVLYRDGRVEQRTEDTAWVTVRSVLPAGDSLPQPAASIGPVPRHPTDYRPLVGLVALVLSLTFGAAFVQRRTRRVREGREPAKPVAVPPVARWIAAGEPRAVASVASDLLRNRIAQLAPEADRALSAEECIAVLEQQRSDWPIRDLGETLRALERARFAPAVSGDVAALVVQVERLLGSLPVKAT